MSKHLIKYFKLDQLNINWYWFLSYYRFIWGNSKSQTCKRQKYESNRILASYLCYTHVGNATNCLAGHQEVSRCCTRGESEESVAHRRGSTQARDPPWLLKPTAGITRCLKQAFQWHHKKDLCTPKNFKKRKKSQINMMWSLLLSWNEFKPETITRHLFTRMSKHNAIFVIAFKTCYY